MNLQDRDETRAVSPERRPSRVPLAEPGGLEMDATKPPLHRRFGLTLAVTADCNLRCSYCYAGEKSARTMPEALGRLAIDRAAASVAPGGRLELGFFGGEPLLESGLVLRLVAHARERASRTGLELVPGLTTNGTLALGAAWELLMLPGLELAVSCDGLPEVHDRHRRCADGRGSFAAVLSTMRRLRAAGRDFSAAVAVRPDSLDELARSLEFLRDEIGRASCRERV